MSWERERHISKDKKLNEIEVESNNNSNVIFKEAYLLKLNQLEQKKMKLLDGIEVESRFKIRATSIDLGDENTKYFHIFTNH